MHVAYHSMFFAYLNVVKQYKDINTPKYASAPYMTNRELGGLTRREPKSIVLSDNLQIIEMDIRHTLYPIGGQRLKFWHS